MIPHYSKPGAEMPDGTIFVAVSPSSGKPFYTIPKDGPLDINWYEAIEFAKSLDMYGHKDWRLPTVAEAELLYDNREIIGNFKVPEERNESSPGKWVDYWTSSEIAGGSYARTWNFNGGKQLNSPMKSKKVFIRLVRG